MVAADSVLKVRHTRMHPRSGPGPAGGPRVREQRAGTVTG